MATFNIRGKNIEISQPLREYVEKRVGKITKYFDNMDEISVLLSVEKERQIHKQKTKLERRFRNGGMRAEAFAESKVQVEHEDESPVVKTKHFVVKPMDVQEAIMQMNLLHHNFFVFRDAQTEQICVVYKRTAGAYGLLEFDG